MEEITMLQPQELKNILRTQVFGDYQAVDPGEVFQILSNSFPLQKISNKGQHRAAVEIAEKVSLFLKRNKLSKNQMSEALKYLDSLGVLIEDYEEVHLFRDLKKVSGYQVLKFLMEQHHLKQKDLERELGGQATVSAILTGKRKLNTRQIVALSNKFGVNPSVFF